MKNSKKRLLSILMVLMMVIGLMSGIRLNADAATYNQDRGINGLVQGDIIDATSCSITITNNTPSGISIKTPGQNGYYNYNPNQTINLPAGKKYRVRYENGQYAFDVVATAVALNKDSTTLTVGDTETLTVTFTPEDTWYKTRTWASDHPEIATVSEDGVVTAVAQGEATITVTATNGTDDTSDDCTATCTVTVNPAASVTTAPTANVLTYTGEPQALVTAGVASGGTMMYAVVLEVPTPPSKGLYTSSIPTGTAVGTYIVWYKVVGDSGSTTPAYVTVTIAEATDTGNTDTESTDTGSTDTGTTDTEDQADDPLLYPEVTVTGGIVQDITSSAEANGEINPFSARISNSDNLIAMLGITDAEQAQGVNVWMDVKDASATMSTTDKNLINNAKGDYQVGLYLDAKLFKKVGAATETSVSNTSIPVQVELLIPQSMWKTGRKFATVRIHNGVSAVLQGAYDESTHRYSFETDRFSSYAIIYYDPVTTAASSSTDTTTTTVAPATTTTSASTGSTASTTSDAPKTGENTNVFLIVFFAASVCYFAGMYKTRRKRA